MSAANFHIPFSLPAAFSMPARVPEALRLPAKLRGETAESQFCVFSIITNFITSSDIEIKYTLEKLFRNRKKKKAKPAKNSFYNMKVSPCPTPQKSGAKVTKRTEESSLLPSQTVINIKTSE